MTQSVAPKEEELSPESLERSRIEMGIPMTFHFPMKNTNQIPTANRNPSLGAVTPSVFFMG
jgi:hypothetical protein